MNHKWIKPQAGMLRMNVDAAINKRDATMGLGSVIRDEDGNFVAARGAQWRGIFTPREAEAVAIREALSWIKSHNMDNVNVETDSLHVVQCLNSKGGVSSFHLIVEDIKHLLHDFCNVFLSFTKRLANQVAHVLARQSCSLSDYSEWFHTPPPIICNLLVSDLC